MPAMLKIEHARFALTLDSERRIIEDASILIEGSRIARVGKAADLESVGADRVIDGHAFVVTPGFYNGHMHISYAHAVRGIFPDDLADRLLNVFKLQTAMTEEEEYVTTLVGILELLQNGTTCFLEPGTTQFPDACLQAYQDTGIRAILGECVTDEPTPLALPSYPTEEAIARTAAFIDRWDGRLEGRIRAWAMPFSAMTASRELLQGAKRVVDERGVGITLHHSIRGPEKERHRLEHNTTPTDYLRQIGLLGPNVLLAHCTGIEDSEADLIAESGTGVVACPTSHMKEARNLGQTGKVPELLERGVPIVLGSDSANSSNHLDVIRSMNLVALQYKDYRGTLKAVPAESALEMGTISGGRAFGLADELGSIERGKKADLVLFDTRRPEWQALFNPVNNLIYNADGRSVDTVIIDGRIVVEGGQQRVANVDGLYERLQEIGEGLQARTGISFPRSRWPIV